MQRIILGGALLGAVVVVAPSPGVAYAQSTCASDADCPTGLRCSEVGGSGCAGAACAPGEECPPPPPCEPEVFYGCVPGPCTTDADCGEGLVCLEVEIQSCAGSETPACAPDTPPEDCRYEPPPEPTCESRTERYCAPRYVAPCQVADDCGEGFDCVAGEICQCSGGGGSGGSSGGATPSDPGAPQDGGTPQPDDGDSDDEAGDEVPPPPEEDSPEPDCSCSPSGENYCQAREIECADDSACPAGWSCGASYDTPVVDCARDDGSAEDCPAPPPPRMLCQPPYTDYGYAGGSAEDSGAVFGAASGDEQATSRVAGRADNDDSGEAPPALPGTGEAGRRSSGSACSVGGAPEPTLLGVLFGLALVAARRRRRA